MRNNTILNVTVALIAVAYITIASMMWYDNRQGVKCSDIEVKISQNSPYGFITDSIVRKWIADSSDAIVGAPVADIDLSDIEQNLRAKYFIDSVESYITMDGKLFITIAPCVPVLRVKSETGYDFYVDSTLKILPIQSHYRAPVPIVSGKLNFEFDPYFFGTLDDKINNEDKEYLKNIINFVESLYSDDFLRELIVQIYVNSSGDIELVPRVGNQIIVFGELVDYAVKLEKLKKFYLNSFSQGWWSEVSKVNLKYKNQVIIS